MKLFLKENSLLLIGIALPILVTLIFGIATFLPKILVKEPQFSFLFVTNYNVYTERSVKFNVIDGKLKVRFSCENCQLNFRNTSKPALYLYDSKLKKAREINYTLPVVPVDAKVFSAEINIPEVTNLKLNTLDESPDGYQFINNRNNFMFNDLFLNGNDHELVISKNGNIINILPGNRNEGYYNFKLIGWIIGN